SRALSTPGSRRRQGDLFPTGKVRKDFARQAKVSLAASRPDGGCCRRCRGCMKPHPELTAASRRRCMKQHRRSYSPLKGGTFFNVHDLIKAWNPRIAKLNG